MTLFTGAPQSLSAAAGTQPVSVAPPSQSTNKYSAIADLESVFSSTSIGSGFGFQGAGVNWVGGGVVAGPTASTMWRPQAMSYNGDGRSQPVNIGQAAAPQMFGASNAANSTAAPPSYATVAGNQKCLIFKPPPYMFCTYTSVGVSKTMFP